VVTLLVAAALGGALVAAARFCQDQEARESIFHWVCWALVVGGVAGTSLAGAGARGGWLLLLGLQPIWIAYALVTGQIGFVLGSVAYAGAQMNGYLRAEPRTHGLQIARPSEFV